MLKNILLEYYDEFTKFGEVRNYSNTNINNYTYNSIAQQYSNILNELPY
jgi:hypothetical protein